MATLITTRKAKGSELEWDEVDANFTNLQTSVDASLRKANNLSDVNDPAAARANIGLGEVNNTSDADKPVSTATTAAIQSVRDDLASDAGSSLVGYLPAGTGAVATDVQSKLRETVSVKDFGAVGDGIASDQTAIVAAVLAAVTDGLDLYWPTGIYVSDSSLTGFWDISHYGSGVIKRGDVVFHINPSEARGQINQLFVDADGNDENDGLTENFPLKTIAKAASIILTLSSGGLRGIWQIKLAAGTYSAGWNMSSLTISEYPIEVHGPDVGGHPNTPLAVIDMSATPGGAAFDQGDGSWIIYRNIKVVSAAEGSGWMVSRGILSLINCHTTATKFPVTYQHGAFLTINGGVYDGSGIPNSFGVRGYYGSSHSIDAPDIPSGAIFKNFTYGLYINEGCFGHLDHTTVTDCDVGVIFSRVDSGSNTKGMRIHRCGIGVQAYCSSWMDNGIDFGIGTADKCTVPVDSRASAEFYERASRNISRTPRYQSSGMWGLSQTNTVDDVTIWTPGEIRPGYARATGDVITIKLIVVPNAANSGNSVVSFRINGVYAGGVQVGPTDGRGVVEAHMLFGTSTEIRSLVTFTSPNANRLDYKTLAVPDSGDITVHLSNASLEDTFSINFGTYETTLGG